MPRLLLLFRRPVSVGREQATCSYGRIVRQQSSIAATALLTILVVSIIATSLAAQTTTPPVDVDWLNDVQQPPASASNTPSPLMALLVNGDGHPVESVEQWERRRAELGKAWLEFLGTLGLDRHDPPELSVVTEDRVGEVIRQLVRYEVEPGIITEAYLLKPAKAKHRAGVVAFHSTINHSIRQPAGVEGKPEKAFGLKLAERGYITFCPRNYLWPDNDHIAAGQEASRFLKRHPRAKGMAKMLFDAQVAVDILASQGEVDPTRIGAIGHSLGAKEVLYLAAFDPRVKVTVCSEGGIGTTFSNWDAAWYLGDTIKGADFKREHHELLALAAPRPFLLLGGDSADGKQSWPFITAALDVYRLYGTPARLGLLNHHKGHAVPPEAERRLYDWLQVYLPPGGAEQ